MTTIASKPFTQLQNLNLLDELRIKGILVSPSGGQDIVAVTTTYQVQVDDDIVSATGTFTVTLVPIATAVKEVTIVAISGTITLAADATIQTPTTLTTGTSVTVYPASGQWFHK